MEDPQALQPEDEDAHPLIRDRPFMLPAGTYVRWSEEEVALVQLEGTLRDAYEKYLVKCFELGIGARTQIAFRRKRIALRMNAL